MAPLLLTSPAKNATRSRVWITSGLDTTQVQWGDGRRRIGRRDLLLFRTPSSAIRRRSISTVMLPTIQSIAPIPTVTVEPHQDSSLDRSEFALHRSSNRTLSR